MTSICKRYASADKRYASADKKYASADMGLLKCCEFASKSEHLEVKNLLIYIYIYKYTEPLRYGSGFCFVGEFLPGL
jgi:hypothetical protein